VVRDRIELSTFRFSGGRSYRLSYLTLARCSAEASTAAVLTGFEPATSTLTGWRALQLLYRTMFCFPRLVFLARKSISPTLLWLPRLSNTLRESETSCPNRTSTGVNRLRRKKSTSGTLVVSPDRPRTAAPWATDLGQQPLGQRTGAAS
jgi:hypothetical protein